MIREIALDTETTGLKPEEGHRIVELGCVELVNHVPTGRTFHHYLYPGRLMEAGATRVRHHGRMLADKPVFGDIAQAFLDFIADAPLVIHNAGFDMAFLNMELERAGLAPLVFERAIDTIAISRRKYPGAPASLDALCKRFGIDLSERTTHGALLDANLLAQVYLELCGGRQPTLVLGAETELERAGHVRRQPRPEPLPSLVTAEELAAHLAFIDGLKGEVIWKQYELPAAA